MPVRQIKANYCSLTGKFASQKLGRLVEWESALERDFYYLAEYDPAISSFEEQPLTLTSNYIKRYTPDAIVTLTSRSFIFPRLSVGKNLIEIKYRAELEKSWQKHRAKFKLAINECRTRGWRFKLITDKEIRSTTLENVKKITHHMRDESNMENELRMLIMESITEIGECDITYLLNYCFRDKTNQLQAIPVIWRLIGDHCIGVNLSENIGLKTKIWSTSEDGYI